MRTQHQGIKYASNPEANAWLKDGFTEWRYKATGEPIPEAAVPDVPNSDKIKISYVRKVVILAKPKPREFVYFEVKRRYSGGTETIGRITEYTTEDRLTSMIYRYYHPEHAQPFTFSGTVLFSGGLPKRGTSRMPYVEIPDSYVEACNLHVDDEVHVEITCMGLTYSFDYHLSQMGLYVSDGGASHSRRMILPLTLVKRLVVVEDPDSIEEDGSAKPIFRFVRKSQYDKHTKLIAKGKPLEYEVSYVPRKTEKNPHPKRIVTRVLPCRRFIDDRVQVTLSVLPEDTTVNVWPNAHLGRYDFVIETLKMFGTARPEDLEEDNSEVE